MIDSGASGCLFHGSIGRAIGLDIGKGTLITTLGIGGPLDVYLHDITLYIPGGPVITKAGFCDNASVAGLLGIAGFFEHFKITFDPTALRVELERVYHA